MNTETLLWTAMAIATAMTLLWLVSVARRDASIVDWLWAPGFALVGWVAFWHAGGASFSGISLNGVLALGLISLWAVRLGGHLFLRNLREGEDSRYAAMRVKAGSRWWWSSYITVFLLQAALIWVISAPLQLAISSPPATVSGLFWVTIAGGVVAFSGLVIEGIADAQLKGFRAATSDHRALLTSGLWRYSRHPNYFGDALFWWGVWLLVLPLPYGLWTIFSPLLMTFLLVKVSGVPMLERTLMASKSGYADYAARTHAFIPWFPKAKSAHAPASSASPREKGAP